MKSVLCCLLLATIIYLVAGLTWYVKPDIGGDGECPSNRVCMHLSTYIDKRKKYFGNDTTLLFLKGTHYLSCVLQVSGVDKLSFRGLSNNSMAVIIECTKTEESGFRLSDAKEITISFITILFCGAQNRNIMKSFENVADVTTHSALMFDNVRSIKLTDVAVRNGSGYGIFTKSCLGHIKIHSSHFDRNEGNSNYAGGNARFCFVTDLLDDKKVLLEIEKSNFTNGKINDNYYDDNHNAGGMHLDSVYSSLNVSLNQVRFVNNLGGNILLKTTSPSVPGKTVKINIKNSVIANGQGYKGAGLSFYALHIPLDVSTSSHYCQVESPENILTIFSTNFIGNAAKYSAGGMLVDVHDSFCVSNKIEMINCVFTSNTVIIKSLMHSTGAGMLVLRHKFPGFYSHFIPVRNQLTLRQVNFIGNFVHTLQASIVELLSIEATEIIDSTFANNTGTALSMRSSNVIFGGQILFNNNTAASGGAMKLCEASSFFINNHTTVFFLNNNARQTGGAIFAQQICVDKHSYCFFQPNVYSMTDVANLKIENEMLLVFINNTAGIAGDAIYGGDIDNCYTYWSFYSGSTNEPSQYLSQEIFENIVSINITSNSTISSDPYKVTFCNSECTEVNKKITVIPGQTFNVSLQALGQRNGVTPAMIEILVISQISYQINVSSSRFFTQKQYCEDIAISLRSNSTNISIQLVFQVLSYYNSLPIEDEMFANLTVSIQNCPWGFEFRDGKCECAKLIKDHAQCFCILDDLTIHCLYPTHWIGCDRDHNDSSCNGKDLQIIRYCPYEYCHRSAVNITADTVDNQCIAGRTGIDCGSCKPNYSIVLGTSECKVCSNSYLWLVVVYLSAGVLLIVLLTSLNITVTNGTLNGLLFYVNIVHANKLSFFPKFYHLDVLRVLIAWLNLDLGIEVCFYNGMDVYHKTWLQFGYVLYIWSLQAAIICLCRRYVFFTRLCGRNVTKVMATLILMCFMKALQTVQDALASTYRVSLNGDVDKVWVADGSIQFGSHKHIPLFAAALFLGFLLLSFTLCLLMIQILNRVSYRRGFRWVSRLQPFFDAFTGPCNENYAFWPGFLFFIRICLLTLYSFSKQFTISQVKTLTTCAIAVMITVLSFLNPNGVYKKWSLNILELSFMVNLAILSAIVNVGEFARNPKTIQLLSYMSLVFGIVIICLYNVKIHFKQIKKIGVNCMKTIVNVRQRLPEECTHHQNGVTRSEVFLATASENESSPLLDINAVPPIRSFVQPREPLIEGN